MKKLAYLGILAGFVLASCTPGDYGIKPAGPQEWPEETPIEFPASITVEAVAPIDFKTLDDETVAVAVISDNQLPEGTECTYRLELDGKYTLALDGELKAVAADLRTVVEGVYGKAPVEREFSAMVAMNIIKDGQAFLVESNEFALKVTVDAPFIASAYYLIGNMVDWSTDNMIRFNHSGNNVYDDPVFTVMFTAGENCYWKIIPQGNVDKADYWYEGVEGIVGVKTDGDAALSGVLTTTAPQAGKIEAAGKYQMIINMLEYTYEIKPMADLYFMVGAITGWNGDAEKGKTVPFFNTSEDGVYSVTTLFTGDHNYKIWNDAEFGNWNVAYGTAVDGDNSANGTIVSAGGAIATPTGNEYYTVTLDFNTNTYSQVKADNQAPESYSTIGLVGDFCGWGDDTDMTQGAEHVWYVLGLEISAEGGIKFRADDAWTANWGDANSIADRFFGTGTAGGDNITIQPGTYDVYFNDITAQYMFVKK